MNKSKEPVRLRQRVISSGDISLNPGIYANGTRTHKRIELYLVPGRTRTGKEKNKETMQLTDAAHAKRGDRGRYMKIYGKRESLADHTHIQISRYGFQCEWKIP